MELTSIVPSVIVPVLSRQSTSTRASVSIQYRSCASVLCLERRITLTQNTVDESATSPEGIMPMSVATVPRTVVERY